MCERVQAPRGRAPRGQRTARAPPPSDMPQLSSRTPRPPSPAPLCSPTSLRMGLVMVALTSTQRAGSGLPRTAVRISRTSAAAAAAAAGRKARERTLERCARPPPRSPCRSQWLPPAASQQVRALTRPKAAVKHGVSLIQHHNLHIPIVHVALGCEVCAWVRGGAVRSGAWCVCGAFGGARDEAGRRVGWRERRPPPRSPACCTTRCGVPTSTSMGRASASFCAPNSPAPVTSAERNLATRECRLGGGSPLQLRAGEDSSPPSSTPHTRAPPADSLGAVRERLAHPEHLLGQLTGGAQHQGSRAARLGGRRPRLVLCLLQPLDCGAGGGTRRAGGWVGE